MTSKEARIIAATINRLFSIQRERRFWLDDRSVTYITADMVKDLVTEARKNGV